MSRFNKIYPRGDSRKVEIKNEKYCRGCRMWKSVDDYFTESDTKDGKQYKCKACAIKQKYGPFTSRSKIEFIVQHFPNVFEINPGIDVNFLGLVSHKLRQAKYFVNERDLSINSIQNLIIRIQREQQQTKGKLK